jgi:hypothetical protein
MRRVTVHKTVGKPTNRQIREKYEGEEKPRERPEVRKDIQRTWWPDG